MKPICAKKKAPPKRGFFLLHLGLSWVDHGGSADATPLHCVASLAGTP